MCVPLSNQSCQVKAALINVNSVESFHYPFVVNNIKLVEGLILLMIQILEHLFQKKNKNYMKKVFKLTSKVNEQDF